MGLVAWREYKLYAPLVEESIRFYHTLNFSVERLKKKYAGKNAPWSEVKCAIDTDLCRLRDGRRVNWKWRYFCKLKHYILFTELPKSKIRIDYGNIPFDKQARKTEIYIMEVPPRLLQEDWFPDGTPNCVFAHRRVIPLDDIGISLLKSVVIIGFGFLLSNPTVGILWGVGRFLWWRLNFLYERCY